MRSCNLQNTTQNVGTRKVMSAKTGSQEWIFLSSLPSHLRNTVLCLMCLVCMFWAVACQKQSAVPSSGDASVSRSMSPGSGSLNLDGYPVRVQDDRGRDIVFHRAPQRIVVAGTALYSEILVDLGVHSRVVGLVEDPNHPPEFKQVPRIGRIWPLSIEKVISLEPDLVLGTFEPYRTQLEKTGKTPVYTGGRRGAALQSVADIFTLIRQLDRICHGNTMRSEALIRRLQRDIKSLQARNKQGRRKKVAMFYMPQPQSSQIYIVTKHTPGHELVEMAGGQNVFAQYPGVATNMEVLLRENPEIIITDPKHVPWIKTHRVLQTMSAIKQNKVYGIPASQFTSSRIIRVFRKIIDILHAAP